MKIIKWLLALLGIAGIIGAGVYTYLGWLDLRNLIAVAESMRSAPQAHPQPEITLAIGLALLGGLLLGAGLAMPRRSASKIRNETLESVAVARETEIRHRATGGTQVAEQGRPADPIDRPDQGGRHGDPR